MEEEEIDAKSMQAITLQRRIFFSVCLAFLFSVSLALPLRADAQSLYFSPASGSFSLGEKFSVSVYASSPDQAANAFSGKISFPTEQLEVTSLSKSGSIMSLWVQEPSFSNGSDAGRVNFEGIVLNPGFKGPSGKLLTINFKVRAVGTAVLSFSAGAMLANDGEGTNILSGLGSARFTLKSAAPEQKPTAVPLSTTPAEKAKVPYAPTVTSPTHSDSNRWYANGSPVFDWVLPAGITGVSYSIDQNSASSPGSKSVGIVSSYAVKDVADGERYFHIRLANSEGWGSITHFRFQIDTVPPLPFTISFPDGQATDNPKPAIRFKTTDALSGLDHYSVKVDTDEPVLVDPATMEHGTFNLPFQNAGKHALVVQAFDKAGNYFAATDEMTIKPLNPPEITEYPEELKSGDFLILKGKTYPSSLVTIWLEKDRDDLKNWVTRSSLSGNFTFISDERVKDGIYKVWAEVMDERGAKSGPSKPITIPVRQSFFWRLLSTLLNYIAIVIPLLGVLLLLLLLLYYSWKKFNELKKRLRQEVRDVEASLHQAFDTLRDDIREQVRFLEKVKDRRDLTAEEERIIKQLRKDLDTIEKYVKKRIDKIEEEVK